MDGGPGGLGTIVSVLKSEMTVTVQWDVTGEQGKYKMGAVAETPTVGEDESAPASVDDLLVSFCFNHFIFKYQVRTEQCE